MKKRLTITGTYNDVFTGYKDKESSMSMIVDMEEDCQCTPFKDCFLHRDIPGYVFTDISEDGHLKQ